MAMRTRGKTAKKTEIKGVEKAEEAKKEVIELPKAPEVTEIPVTPIMSVVNFRTRQTTKRQAEEIFDEMGISMSAALNMFLSQTVREKALPFTPSVQGKSDDSSGSVIGKKEREDKDGLLALEELWDSI